MRMMAIAVVAMLAMPLGRPPLYPVEDCNKAETQRDLNMCARNNEAAAARALNDAYRKLQARQPDRQSKLRLRDAQRAWIAHRNRECAREVGPREGGGSIWPMDMSTCLETKTAARLRELKRRLDCAERANACPR